jgi:hypothetical protein
MMEMMERLLATINADREERRANRKIDKEEINTNNKTIMAEIQAKADVNLKEMRKEIKSGQAGLRSMLNAWLTDIKNDRKETMAFLEKTKARLEVEEPASEDRTPEVAHDEEVPKEDAVVMPVGEPRKRRRNRRSLAALRRQKEQDQNLDARRCRKEQRRAQRKDGCRRNLVAARRGTIRRAQVARRAFLLTEETSREFHGSRKGLVAARRGRPAVQKRHGARKSPSEGTTPRTRSSEENKDYGRSGRDFGHAR